MRIELEDTPQPGRVSLAQAVVRCVLGAILLLHGFDKLHDESLYAAQLARAGLPEVYAVTMAVLCLELGAGAALLLGRYTRAAAFVGTCDVAGQLGLGLALGALRQAPASLELLALMLAVSMLFMVVGSGPFGLDHVLRRRARLRAIARDEIWSRPPYVSHR